MKDRREAARRSRIALGRARRANPLSVAPGPRKGEHRLITSGHERNFWVGYHLAYAEMATGRRPQVEDERS